MTKHRFLVFRLCCGCGLYRQGLVHDLSKYSPTEFYYSAKYYLGYRSPIGEERRACGYSRVYLHHKGRNKHHFEYWDDPYSPNGHISMPFNYLAESICDRIAACKTYLKADYTDSEPLKYFLNDHKITDRMNEDERALFADYLNYLAHHGEKALLKRLRRDLKEYRRTQKLNDKSK